MNAIQKHKFNFSDLNQRVKLEIANNISDNMGGLTEKWQYSTSLWCSIKHIKDQEANNIHNRERCFYSLIFRYGKIIRGIVGGLSSNRKLRVTHRNSVFLPKSISLDQNKRFISMKVVLSNQI